MGILASLDPVAIDRASLDMIDKAVAIDGSGLPEGPDRMGRLHNVDSLVQLRSAERLGLGSMDYRLLEHTDSSA